jgi:hypothetical protein
VARGTKNETEKLPFQIENGNNGRWGVKKRKRGEDDEKKWRTREKRGNNRR